MKKGDFGRPFLWVRYFIALCFLQAVVDDGVHLGYCETNPATKMSLL